MRVLALLTAAAGLLAAPSAQASCPDPADAGAYLAEVLALPAADRAIELRGAPGASLDCVSVVGWRDTGSGCTERLRIDLDGHTMPTDGVFLISVEGGAYASLADLIDSEAGKMVGTQFALAVHFGEDPLMLDGVAWGTAMPTCEPHVGATDPLPSASSGSTFLRCDKDDPATPFQVCHTPSLGADSACACPVPPPACPELPAVLPWFSEIQSRPVAGRFVEVEVPAGVEPGCFEVRGYRQVTADETTWCQQELAYRMLVPELNEHGLVAATSPTSDWSSVEGLLLDAEAGKLRAADFALGLYFLGDDDSEVLIDHALYGGPLGFCEDLLGAPDAVGPNPGLDRSLIRCFQDGTDALAECDLPSPGQPAACDCPEPPPACPPGAPDDGLHLKEIQSRPTSARFIELGGDPGAALGCYEILGYRQQSSDEGPTCQTSHSVIDLLGAGAMPESGLLAITSASSDWADPELHFLASAAGSILADNYGLALVYRDDEGGEEIVDRAVYGGPLEVCADLLGAPDAAGPNMPLDHSVIRCPADGTDLLAVCDDPTPGTESPCVCPEPPPPCPVEPPDDGLRFSEVQSRPTSARFIELAGDPGALLGCYQVRGFREQTDEHDQPFCQADHAVIDLLTAGAMPSSGLLGITSPSSDWADPGLHFLSTAAGSILANNYGLALVYLDDEGGEHIIDQAVYGGPLDACAEALGEPDARGSNMAIDQSLIRCPVEEATDLLAACDTPTPGTPTACTCPEPPPPCPAGPPEVAPIVSEVQSRPTSARFIELQAPEGTALACYQVRGFREKEDEGGQPTCETDHMTVDLVGAGAMPESGYFAITSGSSDWADEVPFHHAGAGAILARDYGLAVYYVDDEGDEFLTDLVVYGGPLDHCEEALGAPDAVGPNPGLDNSLVRCADGTLQACATPSPGQAPACACSDFEPPEQRRCNCATGLGPGGVVPLLLVGLLGLWRRRPGRA